MHLKFYQKHVRRIPRNWVLVISRVNKRMMRRHSEGRKWIQRGKTKLRVNIGREAGNDRHSFLDMFLIQDTCSSSSTKFRRVHRRGLVKLRVFCVPAISSTESAGRIQAWTSRRVKGCMQTARIGAIKAAAVTCKFRFFPCVRMMSQAVKRDCDLSWNFYRLFATRIW